MVVAIILALIMSIAHFFSEQFAAQCGSYRDPIISLSAGVSITYIFLDLFPRFITAVRFDQALFFTVLIGFGALHVIEKYLYKHLKPTRLRRNLRLEESTVSFVYHFFVGIVLTSIVAVSVSEGILFFLPVLLYTGLSTLPVTLPKIPRIKLILSASTFLGAVFAFGVAVSSVVSTALMGFIIGFLLFSATRHSLPREKKGRPLFFIIGMIGYSLLIAFTWTL